MVWISNNQIYSVQTLSVNYTTCVIRRDGDTVNPRNHNFVMVPLVPLKTHLVRASPRVYHTFVSTNPGVRSQNTQRMEFL